MTESISARVKIDLQFKIRLEGAMAIGSGFSRRPIQRTVMRDFAGRPYIPASTLKGCVRDTAERLARTLGLYVCEGPNPRLMCGATQSVESFCLICRAFGSPGLSSVSGYTGLTWRDAHLEMPRQESNDTNRHEVEFYYYARTQAQLSRLRGTALEKRLFTSENTIENLIFTGRIRGWLPPAKSTASRFPAELVLLCSALKLVRFVGGSKSRGLGNCHLELSAPLWLNDQPIELSEVVQAIADLKQPREA